MKPLTLGYVDCAVCANPVKLKVLRDIGRKKYCSRSCANKATSLARIAAMPERTCARCGTTFKAKSTTHVLCSKACVMQEQVARSYKYLNGNAEAYIRHLCAKPGRKGLAAYMLEMYHKQQGLCAITGVPMTFVKEVGAAKCHTNLSIDQITASGGYVKGNIQLVCAVVNTMKWTLTETELRWWCERILSGSK